VPSSEPSLARSLAMEWSPPARQAVLDTLVGRDTLPFKPSLYLRGHACAAGDHSIAKLRASDGSLLGTFNVGTYTGWPSTAPTFWVVNTGSDDKQAKAEAPSCGDPCTEILAIV